MDDSESRYQAMNVSDQGADGLTSALRSCSTGYGSNNRLRESQLLHFILEDTIH